MTRKTLAFLLIVALLTSLSSAYAAPTGAILLDEQPVDVDYENRDGTIYVPLTFFSDTLGLTVTFDENISFVKGDATMVPLRQLCEANGIEVGWEASAKQVLLTRYADTIFVNGAIYTMVEEGHSAQALAVRGDTIVYVGDADGVKLFDGPNTETINLEGSILTPGFMDGHIHAPGNWMDRLFAVTLEGLATEEEYLAAVKAFVEANPDAKLVQGGTFDMNLFAQPDGTNPGPTKEALDSVCPDIPVILRSVDYHSVWVNSIALERAGITKDTPNPTGGLIARNADGTPRGMLTDAAIDLLAEIQAEGEYTEEQFMEGFREFQKEANALGITGMNSIDLFGGGEPILNAFKDLYEEGSLTLRVSQAITPPTNSDPADTVAEMNRLRDTYANEMVRVDTIKIFADGVTEGVTAVFLEPYLPEAGQGDNFLGELEWELDKFNAMIAGLDKAGLQVHVHAIGDGAVRMTLDAYEAAQAANGVRDARHTMTHVCAISKEDIPRVAELNVISALQFLWMYADPLFDLEKAMIGEERAMAMYPVKDMLEAGCLISGASDAPVTPYDVLDEIQVGVTRDSPYPGESGLYRWPEQALTPYQMLEAYTKNVAYQNFAEDIVGTLQVGKKADLVVLGQDILTCDPTKIAETEVLYTFSNGKLVYQK